jgi:hypothetical protein
MSTFVADLPDETETSEKLEQTMKQKRKHLRTLFLTTTTAIAISGCQKHRSSKDPVVSTYEDPSQPSEFGLDAAPESATLASPDPAQAITTSTITLRWNAGQGATSYFIGVGTTADSVNKTPWGNIVTRTLPANTLSMTVSGIPVTGQPVFIRLWTKTATWSSIVYEINTEVTNETLADSLAKINLETQKKLDEIKTQNANLASQNADLTSKTVALADALENAKKELADKIDNNDKEAMATYLYSRCTVGSVSQTIYGQSSLDLLDDCKLWATSTNVATWTLATSSVLNLPTSTYFKARCVSTTASHGYLIGQSTLEIRRACIAVTTAANQTFRNIEDITYAVGSSTRSSSLLCVARDNDGRDPWVLATMNGATGAITKLPGTQFATIDQCRQAIIMARPTGNKLLACIARDNDGRDPWVGAEIAPDAGTVKKVTDLSFATFDACTQGISAGRTFMDQAIICTARDGDGRDPWVLGRVSNGTLTKVTNTVLGNIQQCNQSLNSARISDTSMLLCSSRDRDGRDPWSLYNLTATTATKLASDYSTFDQCLSGL